jgi:predicted nuclease with RNAse H fold
MSGFRPLDTPATVAGIDIGGERKGCHLVVLRGAEMLCNSQSREPQALARQCLALGVQVIGIDAPCRWSPPTGGRAAERQLAQEGIPCFATPTRERALANRTGFYGWMFNGERVYQALAATHRLLATPAYSGGSVCFETFPHAITCALLGIDVASARQKATQRRQLLARHGLDVASLASIDAVDAALCAVSAHYLVAGCTKAYGDAEGGYIVVPALR